MRTSKFGFVSKTVSGLPFKANAIALLFIAALPGLAFARYERVDNDVIVEISEKYVGLPYKLGPLGEGSDGRYDADPLSRFDKFDCTTFVETMMALSVSKTEKQFDDNLRSIRYLNGAIGFETRNHFTDLDWIPNNVAAGFIEDVTEAVADGLGGSLVAEAVVSKRGWYGKMGASAIEVPGLGEKELELRLTELRSLGAKYRDEIARVPYIHNETILGEDGEHVNHKLLARIPNGAVINMVRPNWDLTDAAGTHQNVSHQTLAVWKGKTLYIRHASSGTKDVTESKLTDYLRKYLGKKNVQGINILRVK